MESLVEKNDNNNNEAAPLLQLKPGEYTEILQQLREGITFVVEHLDDSYRAELGISPDDTSVLNTTYAIHADDAPRIRSLKAMLNSAYHINNALTSLNNNGYKVKVLAYDLPKILLDIRHLDIGSDFGHIKKFLSENMALFTDQFEKFRKLDGNEEAMKLITNEKSLFPEDPGWSDYFIKPMAEIEKYISEKFKVDLPESGKYCGYVDNDKRGNSLKAMVNILRHTSNIMVALDKGITVSPNDTWANIKSYDGYRYYSVLQEVLAMSADFDHLDTDQITDLVNNMFNKESNIAEELLFSLAFSIDQFEIDLGLKAGTIFNKFKPMYDAFFEISKNVTLKDQFTLERLQRHQVLLSEHEDNIKKRQGQIGKLETTQQELLKNTRVASVFDLPVDLIDNLCDLFDIKEQDDQAKKITLINLCSNSLIERCKDEQEKDNAEKNDKVGFFGNIANVFAHKLGYQADTGYAFCQEMSELLTIRNMQFEEDIKQSTLTNTILKKRIEKENENVIQIAADKVLSEAIQSSKKAVNDQESVAHINPLPAPKAKAKSGLVKMFFGLVGAFFKDVFRAIGNWFKKVFTRKAQSEVVKSPSSEATSTYQKLREQNGFEPGTNPENTEVPNPNVENKKVNKVAENRPLLQAEDDSRNEVQLSP